MYIYIYIGNSVEILAPLWEQLTNLTEIDLRDNQIEGRIGGNVDIYIIRPISYISYHNTHIQLYILVSLYTYLLLQHSYRTITS